MVRSVLERKRGKQEKREEKESKGKPEKGRNEGERRRSCKSSIVAVGGPNFDPTKDKRYGPCLFGYFPFLRPWKWHRLSFVVTLMEEILCIG